MTAQKTTNRTNRGSSDNKKVLDRIREITDKKDIVEAWDIIEQNLKAMGVQRATIEAVTIVYNISGLVNLGVTTGAFASLDSIRAFNIALDQLKNQIIEPRRMDLLAQQIEKQKKMDEAKNAPPVENQPPIEVKEETSE